MKHVMYLALFVLSNLFSVVDSCAMEFDVNVKQTESSPCHDVIDSNNGKIAEQDESTQFNEHLCECESCGHFAFIHQLMVSDPYTFQFSFQKFDTHHYLTSDVKFKPPIYISV